MNASSDFLGRGTVVRQGQTRLGELPARYCALYRETRRLVFLLSLLALGSARLSHADFSGLDLIVDLPGSYTQAVFAPNETHRMFLLGRFGGIKILDLTTDTVLPTNFLQIPAVDTQGEGAAISMTFHPDFATNGKFYVNATIDNGGIVIEEGTESPFTSHLFEYTVSADPNIANPTPKKIIEWVQPWFTHNSGWMGFSPNDGYLYAMAGDGGMPVDDGPGHTEGTGNAQDITDNLFGKILRLDVDGPDAYPDDPDRNYAIPSTNPFVGVEGDDEIWALGVRNAFRGSFDRATGDLYFGDVGLTLNEEINFQPADSTGGENYGWRLREGTSPTSTTAPGIAGPRPPNNVDPIYNYRHIGRVGSVDGFDGNSVTGGYVYRGPDPTLQGQYLFADFVSKHFWRFDPSDPDNTVVNLDDVLSLEMGQQTGFAEDANGNLYVINLAGQVYRILTDTITPGDFDANARVDAADLTLFETGFGIVDSAANSNGDSDGDGDVDSFDYLNYQRNFGYDALDATSLGAAVSVPEPSTMAWLAAFGFAWSCCRRARNHATARMLVSDS